MNRVLYMKWLSSLLWVVLIAVGALLCISASVYTHNKSLTEIVLSTDMLEEGASLISDAEIKTIVHSVIGDSILGLAIDDLSLDHIENSIGQNPFVEKVDVYVTDASRLTIDVVQRQPLCRIFKNNGENFYLDANGRYMPLCPDYSVRSLVVSGHVPPMLPSDTLTEEDVLYDVCQIASEVASSEFLKAFVQEIYIDSDAGFLLIPKIGDFKIKLLTSEDLAEKFYKLEVFLKKIVANGSWSKYDMINIEYKDQIVTTKKNV